MSTPVARQGRIMFAQSFLARMLGIVAIAAAAIGCGLCIESQLNAGPQNPPAAETIRIGTFDSRCVATAYGRSPAFADRLKQLHQQRAEAQKAGDKARVAQLETQAENIQLRLHLQVFSNAPVDDVLEHVRSELPAIASRSDVIAIVPAVEFHDPAVELVDLTDDLIRLFEPDAQTLKTVGQLRKHKPQAIEEVARMPIVK